MLSLQQVCFKARIRIPRHSSNSDEQVRQDLPYSIPDSIAIHVNGSTKDSSSPTTTMTLVFTRHRTDFTTPSNNNQGTASFNSNTFDNNSLGDELETTDLTQTVMLSTDSTITNNMTAIQSLRLLFRENANPLTNIQSPLQLSVPHDQKIDLIPTVHMRDRMILFKDHYDLEEEIRLLMNEAISHGG
ncbi:hypothetical protein BC941DRAFT_467281 [Chlamydoabsidia padenii]|nr:hypothetical protein BC941DRAFT_467281 [Chlamydoabsidia padenii]